MSGNLTRRSLMAGAGYAAACSTVAARLLAVAEAQQAQPKAAPALRMNMYFPLQPKARIDEKLYTTKHMPMLRRVYGDSVERIEFHTSQAPSQGMPPASSLASAHIWIKDAQKFSKALTDNSNAINLDLDAAAKGPRIVQIDKLAAALGEESSEVKVGSQLMTIHYPLEAGMKWDDKYFTTTHLPKLMAAYGQSAVRRIEGLLGVPQGDAKPKYRATVQLYIRERGAFDGVVQSGRDDLIDDVKKFTTIIPEFNEFRVQAIV